MIDYAFSVWYDEGIKRRSWTEKQLQEAVRVSSSYRQALSKLGLRPAGGNYEQIKKYKGVSHKYKSF